MNNETKCHHFALTSPDILRAEETALLPAKTLENSACPELPPLFDYIRVYKSSCTSKGVPIKEYSKRSSDDDKEENTHICATLKEKSGYSGQSGQKEKQNPDLLAAVTAKYPDLVDTDSRRFVSLLLGIYGRRFTLPEVEWLEFFYRQVGIDLWKFVRGENQGPQPPRGMACDGVFLAGRVTGNAIHPDSIPENCKMPKAGTR